ncbi:glycosyltransferase family 39 protein [Gryllotalpicola reticulitermitis]|uniref:Glycosyltransferase family 39 protein n=1 Tax=Gryllotalpicola reticulitermitis TaxID=1184153 RepID=A0ABV8Q6L3_9MICO
MHVFRGQPRWALISLASLLCAAALLYTWGIGYSGVSPYYAASAVSMSRRPLALLTGALNPAATITLDKLSGAFVPQALAVRIFGVHAWAMSLPQAIEGVITVLAAWAIAVRWRGTLAGVLTAGGVAFTPMLAAMFGRPMEDGMLTMTCALAVLAAQRAALSGHGRWLLLAACWVGVGFQAKMLQAWFIVPAVLLIYLLGTRGRVARRVVWAAIGAVAMLLASISWITVIELVPAAVRPFADGTTDGNFFTMVFGYNGIDRIVPGLWPGSVPQLDSAAGGGQGAPSAPVHDVWLNPQHSPVKMLLPGLATQIGWLYPVAFAGALIETALLLPGIRRRLPAGASLAGRRADLAMLVGLVAWFGVTALLLAAAWVPHATYYGPIAVPLVLLAVAGGMRLFDWWRDRVPRWRWAAPGVMLASTAWQTVVSATGPAPARWSALVVVAVGVIATLVLVTAQRSSSGRRAAAITMIVAIAVAPVAWSTLVIFPGLGGSASDAWAGPRPGAHTSAAQPRAATAATAPATATATATSDQHSGIRLRAPFAVQHDLALTPQQRELVDYVVARAGDRHPLFATDTLAVAVSVILETHDDAIPMGGFSQQAPTPTLAQLRAYLRAGTIRYVLLADPDVPRPANPTLDAARAWVRGHCTPALAGEFRSGTSQGQTLYDCRAKA